MTNGDDSCDLLCLDLPHAEEIRSGLPALPELELAASMARALADPTRLRIAAALCSGGELCVCDVSWVAGQAQNLVSHHLRQLKVAGLVTSRREGRLVMYAMTELGRGLMAAVLGERSAPAAVTEHPADQVTTVVAGTVEG